MLDMKHFHVVLALPAPLRPLARSAPAVLCDVLLRTVGRTLLGFGHRSLNSTLGVTLVLQTWTRELDFDPHARAIGSAGGLCRVHLREYAETTVDVWVNVLFDCPVNTAEFFNDGDCGCQQSPNCLARIDRF